MGALGTSTDVDWWKLVLAQTTDVLLETAPGAGAQIGDTALTLLDASGAPLRSADNGVAAGLYAEHFDMAEATPQTWGEMGWILEVNKNMNKAMEAMGGDIVKTFRIYEKPLDGHPPG